MKTILLLLILTATALAQGPEPAPWWQRVEEAQSFALKWLAALTVIGGALAAFIAFVIGKVNELKARVERQSVKTDAQQQQITDLAMNAPAPPAGKPIRAESAGGAVAVGSGKSDR